MDGRAKTAEEIMGEIEKLCQLIDEAETEDSPLKKLNEHLPKQIAEHNQSEEKLSEDALLLQSILGAMRDGITIQDLDYTVTYQNDVVTKIFGDRTGEKCYKAYEGKKEVCESCPVELAYKDGRSHTSVRKVVSPSGETMYWENTANPIRDAAGNIVSCLEINRKITERKKTKEQLHFLSAITEQVADSVITTDLNYKITYANHAFQELYGYSRDELLGQSTDILNAAPNSQEIQQDIYETIFSGRTWRGEAANRRKDGSTFPCELTIFPLKDEQGNTFAYAGTQRDITERKKAEEKLQESEERYRVLVEGTENFVTRVDKEGKILFVNQASEQVFGLKPEECVGLSAFDFVHSDDREMTVKTFLGWLCDKTENIAIENRQVSRSGEVRNMLWKCKLVFEESGELAWIDSIAQDITKRKHAEEKLKRQQYYLEKAQEIGRIGTWDLDIKKNKLVWTDENYRIFGLPLGTELTYETFLNCVHPDDREYVDREWKAAFLDRKPYDIEHRIVVEGKIKWVREKAELEFDENGDCVRGVGFAQDITKHKEAEEELARSEERFRRAVMESPFPIMIHAEDGEVIQINKVWTELTGYEPEEIPTLSAWTKRAYGERKDVVKSRIDKIFDCETSVDEGEYVISSKDDKTLVWDFSAASLGKLPDGRRLVISIAKNVTERKQAEEALRESESELKAVYENAPLVMLLVDRERRVIKMNAQALSMARRSMEESIGLRGGEALRCVHSSDDPKGCGFGPACEDCGVRNSVLRAFETGKTVHRAEALIPYDHPDGPVEMHVLVSAIPLTELEEDIVLVCLEDITKRRKVEEALRQKEETVRALVETSQDMIWEIDLEGIHTYCNPAIEQILGRRVDELVGRSSLEFMHEEDRRMVEEKLSGWIAKKSGWRNVIIRWRHKDGSYRFLESNAVPILNSQGKLVGFRGVDRDITERKRAEEVILQEKQRLEDVADSVECGLMLLDSKAGIVYANKLVEKWFDSAEKMVGRPCCGVMQMDPEQCPAKRVLETGQKARSEMFATTIDGQERFFQVAASPINDSEGKVSQITQVIIDITELKHAEKLLRQNEERFRLLYEESPIGYQSLDSDGRFVEVNQAWLSLLGYEKDEVIGRSFADFLAGGFPELFMERFPCFKAAGEVCDVAFEMVKKDGSHIDVEIDGRIGYNPDGSFRQTHCVLHDVTERKRNEELLREEARMRNTILDNLPCIAMILKKGTREIIASNKVARQAGAVPGQTCHGTVAQRGDNCPFCLAPEVWETDETRRLEVEYRGTYYEGIWVPLTEDLYVHYIFDITERKQAEKELKRHQAELAHIWRVNTMGEMASGLAHELNQPLCAILNYAGACTRIMKGQADESGQVVGALEEISSQADRAGQIIRRLRTLVAKGQPRQSIVSINDVVEEVLEMEKAEVLDLNITIKKELGDDLPTVVADPIQIEQVVLNIVRNAFDAVADKPADERRVTVCTSVGQGNCIEVAVSDTGIGFISDIGERLFDPFFTTKAKGLGVGLSLSRSIIEAHGGKLQAEANQDGGATFRFTLPVKGKEKGHTGDEA